MSQICEVCGGTGCQTVTTTIVAYGEKPRRESPARITCIWCNGTGHMSQEEVQEVQNYRDAWCRCEPDERRESFIWNYHSARYDTVCKNCHKFIAVG